MGPIALLRGKVVETHKDLCAAITLRYSDAPKETQGIVSIEKDNGTKSEILTNRAEESDYIKYRI
jgi:hypothetical protein